MKYLVILIFSFALLSNSAHAQDKYKKHTVAKGETITEIAKKYKVTPYDIYKLNPDSQNGIKENAVLLIPTQPVKQETEPVKEKTTKVVNTIHEVEAKETFYSLAKKYNVEVEDIQKANPEIKELQIGQKIVIPIKGSGVAAQAKRAEKQEVRKDAPTYMTHTVEAGETKYSIAKKYGMTVQLLEELNPEVKDNLPLGFKLKLDKNSVVAKEIPSKNGNGVQEYITYTVQPKETFYSLGKKTGLSQEQIIALNPEAKDGLKDGMELKLPAGTNVEISDEPVVLVKGSLTKTLKKNTPKEMALLLPFNLASIESDSTRTQNERLRSDKFLNMTLDFYAGALMAIDSAKALGLPLKVRILDSKETKNTSAIETLKGSLANMDAVVGPFFQGNVERTAQVLKGVPVISPLSKETGKPFANLYQSIPSADMAKMAMLDYLKEKNGNVVAVVDPKKGSSKQFISTNYPGAKFTDGTVTADLIRPLLETGKMNYVILETESVGMIGSTTKALTALQEQYQIQLVVLEKTDVLDHDEISLQRLTALKMLYPSITNDSESAESVLFAKVFKEKNGAFPSLFATRGFDVTFDVILRLFQEESFAETTTSKASEQVENKFAYKSVNGGNYNTGVYILYYDTDLSVKKAE